MIGKRYFPALLAALIASGGCGITPESYYPMKEGSESSYRVNTILSTLDGKSGKLLTEKKEGRFSSRFLPKQELKGKTVIPRKDVLDGTQTSYSYILKENKGLAMYAYQGTDAGEPEIFSEPSYLIKSPLNVGESWTGFGKSHLAKDQTVPMKTKITIAKTPVDVPAGKFKECLEIRSEGVNDFDVPPFGKVTIRAVTVRWFAPKVGLVKEIVHEESTHPSLGTIKLTYERTEPGK